jgi:hypothetical protein
MPLFLDTSGRATVGIGICARCSQKFPLEELAPDVNYPGLMVCRDDMDEIDPYRLPPRETESITLMYPRPDVPLQTTSVAPGSAAWPVSQFPDDGLQAAQTPSTGNSS